MQPQLERAGLDTQRIEADAEVDGPVAGRSARRRWRTDRWDAYLGARTSLWLPDGAKRLGVERPPTTVEQWIGRQVALLDARGDTLALAEICALRGSPSARLRCSFDDMRYFFYITNDWSLTDEQVVQESNQRCNQEDLIAQLKDGVRALHAPVNSLNANWAYMVMASLAWTGLDAQGVGRPLATGPQNPGRFTRALARPASA